MNDINRLILSGPPALSKLRLEKIGKRIPGVVFAEYLHIVECEVSLSPQELKLCEDLLDYGPKSDPAKGRLLAPIVLSPLASNNELEFLIG